MLAFLAILLLATPAETPQGNPQCVLVHYTLHSYNGPVDIDNTCKVLLVDRGDHIQIETIDFGDGVFRGDFEVWPN